MREKHIRNYVNVYRRAVAVSAGYEADDTAGADRQPDFKGNPGKSWLPDRRRTGLSLPFQSDGNTFRRRDEENRDRYGSREGTYLMYF